MSLPPITKDPQAVLDYTFDWQDSADPYLQDAETISISAWAVSPTDELAVDSNSKTDTTATVTVSGGEAGSTYRLTNTIETSNGRTEERSLIIIVVQR